MDGWVDAGALESLPPGKKKCVEVGAFSVALVNLEGTVHAIDNNCPHRGGPLASGDLMGTELWCPLHAWPFDVRTGKCTLFEHAQVRVFDVRVEEGRILVAAQGRFT